MLADITVLDNNVKSLTSAIKGYNGGIFGIVQMASITTAFAAVHTSNRKAYSDAQFIASQFSDADSASIVTLVQKTLVLDNPLAVALLESKKALFAQSLLTGAISSALKTLMDDHVTLSAALAQWVSPSELTAANQAVATITASLQEGIDCYSS
jgi:hypothetical protein